MTKRNQDEQNRQHAQPTQLGRTGSGTMWALLGLDKSEPSEWSLNTACQWLPKRKASVWASDETLTLGLASSTALSTTSSGSSQSTNRERGSNSSTISDASLAVSRHAVVVGTEKREKVFCTCKFHREIQGGKGGAISDMMQCLCSRGLRSEPCRHFDLASRSPMQNAFSRLRRSTSMKASRPGFFRVVCTHDCPTQTTMMKSDGTREAQAVGSFDCYRFWFGAVSGLEIGVVLHRQFFPVLGMAMSAIGHSDSPYRSAGMATPST